MNNVRYEYYHDRETTPSVQMGHSTLCSPHFHRSLEILYVLEGEMITSVGESTFITDKDEIAFVHNYYRHSFTPHPAYEKVFVVIPADFSFDFDEEFRRSTLPAHLTDRDFNSRVIKDLFLTLHDCRDAHPLILKGYLTVMLGRMLSHYPTVPIERNDNIELLVRVLNYIDLNYDKPITLDSVSATFGYNKYYFSRLFNRVVGENLSNYVNIVRLRHFMQLRKQDDASSVSQLAFSCGFNSLTTFYRCYNKIYPFSPKIT